MKTAIKVDRVRKLYDSFYLNDICFEVPKGYITGFIGPNGSGKTTTIKSILQYISIDGGSISIDGDDIKDRPYINENIGIIVNHLPYVKDWKISDLINAISPFYKKWDDNKIKHYLAIFELKREMVISSLSTGMGIKLMLAVALSHDADILVLDEPTSGLDPIAREEICEILQNYMKDEGKTVLFSTHITADLDSIADYIVYIYKGEIIFSGEKEQLLNSYILVSGGVSDLDLINSENLVGVKKNGYSFQALVKNELGIQKNNLEFQHPTLDDIILLYNRGEVNE